jgi:type IV secretory pathway VirB10-like protein
MASYDPRAPHVSPGMDEPAPRVAIRQRAWVIPVVIAIALALGGLVFWQLSQGRERLANARLTDPAANAKPIIGTQDLPAPARAPDPAPVLQPEPVFQSAAAPEPAPAYAPGLGDPTLTAPGFASMREAETAARLKAPALVVDLSEPGSPPNAGADPAAGKATAGLSPRAVIDAAGGGARAPNADAQFSADLRISGDGARAEPLAHPSQTVIEGTVMAAVLETAVNSDLPGLARAVISRDVLSFDGKQVLIPRGSRVIGQYKSGVALGQSRAFVIWNRLIRPDGASIILASPGTDELGRGGLEGKVDRHFLRRFGGSVLLSLISAATAAATEKSDTQIIIAGSRGGADAAAVALQKEIDQPPTITVAQGAPIRIFVARDLDFSSLGAGR